MSTHIGAAPGEIAERVLLPGDPLRAKWIAETFLNASTPYTTIRNMYGFTGTYQGVPVSVQGSGMGMPSASIYAHELINDYGVRSLIRVGTCGALAPDLRIRDVIAASGASTDSAMNRVRFHNLVDYAPVADFGLLRAATDAATNRDINLRVGPIFSADAFYTEQTGVFDVLADHGVLAVEMECAALYTIAARFGVRALTVLTVSDHIRTGEQSSAADREQTFGSMVQVPWTPWSPTPDPPRSAGEWSASRPRGRP